MIKTDHCSIQENEILAELVQEYPCLYNKSHAWYKAVLRKKNAWAKVDERRNKLQGSSSHDWEIL